MKKIPISEGGSAKFAIGNKKTNDHQWVETGGNFHFKITIANALNLIGVASPERM